MDRYDVVLYTPPRKQPRVDNKQGRSDESGGSSTALVLYSQPATAGRSPRCEVPANLKGSGCSRCRWRGCRSCKDAGGKQSVPSASHGAPAAATKAKKRCSSADDDNPPTPSAKRQKQRPDGAEEEPPTLVLPHGRAQDGLQELRELGESVPLLRRRIVSATPRRGVHDPKQTCTNADVAGLLGVKIKGFYTFWSALREGHLPAQLLAPDGTWVDSVKCARRLHDVRFWVEKRGIVAIATLHEKLARAERGQAQTKRQALGTTIAGDADVSTSSNAIASEGASATPLPPATPVATPLVLHWRNERDELKRTVMVSTSRDLPGVIWPCSPRMKFTHAPA